jgi:hypothetical protein
MKQKYCTQDKVKEIEFYMLSPSTLEKNTSVYIENDVKLGYIGF